jgi:hypothetical protein
MGGWLLRDRDGAGDSSSHSPDARVVVPGLAGTDACDPAATRRPDTAQLEYINTHSCASYTSASSSIVALRLFSLVRPMLLRPPLIRVRLPG